MSISIISIVHWQSFPITKSRDNRLAYRYQMSMGILTSCYIIFELVYIFQLRFVLIRYEFFILSLKIISEFNNNQSHKPQMKNKQSLTILFFIQSTNLNPSSQKIQPFTKMGNICCSQKQKNRQTSTIISVRQKSLTDPSTKKQYEKSLESILNQALKKFQQNYKIHSLKLQGLIGKGGQASVFQVDVLCQKDDQLIVKKFAMKRVSKKYITKQKVRQALFLQKEILTSHPSSFVTQIDFACQDQAYIYFFMKMAIGGDCYPFVRDPLCFSYIPNSDSGQEADKVRGFQKLGEKAIVFILAAVVLGMQSLHSLNVIYRDLKPQNILIFEDGYPKLADFGVAAKFDDEEDKYFDMKGTILYFAPQILKKKGYDRAIDFWALGVLAYELTFKEPPFSSSYISSSLYQAKIINRLKENTWPSFKGSKQMRDFINKLLVLNPQKRLGYVSFQQIKQHRLFQAINWRDFQRRAIASPLIKLLSVYPLKIKREAEINEIVDFENHGYLPFTFVRNTNDTERKTVQIVQMNFEIDDHMNLKWEKQIKEDREQRDYG